MHDHCPISDEELQLVVLDQPTETPIEQIETYIAECKHCQDRLLELAAETSWREEFCSSMIAIGDQSAFDETDTRNFDGDRNVQHNAFDLKTINQMLEGVLDSPTHPETLGSLGRYEVEKVIGFGGMGIVLRGFDHELHRPVAIKMIAPRLVNNGTAKERFLREAKAAGALLHPNVIAIHDISETNGVPWFVMPLVVGPTLQEVVEKSGPLPAKEVVRIGKQIASGLAAAHQQGLVHRDIKPANILVDNQINRIVITDFGLARREEEESMTQTGMVAGTLNYMSPEQSRGEDVDARSDLFSLGSLLFFLTTGVSPFQASTPMGVIHKVGNSAPAKIQSLNPDAPARLGLLIERLLEKKPEHRFQSSGKVEEWLASYLAHLNQPVQMHAPILPASTRKKAEVVSGAKQWFVGIGALAITAVAIFYAGTWFGDSKAANPKATSSAPTVSWQEIKQKYQIETPDVFESELTEFDQKLQGLKRDFDIAPSNQFSDSFHRDLDGLSTQLNQLNQDFQRSER